MKRYNTPYTAFLLAALYCGMLTGCGGKTTQAGKAGAFGANIFETGELAAVNSHAFVLPRYGRSWSNMRITGILEHGSIVEAGDSVIQLDPTEIQKYILDRESSLETQQASLEVMLVTQKNTFSGLESSYKSALATFELQKIELESSKFESERTRRIKELQFKQAEITMAKDEKKIELSKIINENNLKIQRIRVQQIENDIVNAKEIIPQLTIRTPIGGVFQIAWRNRAQIKVGDNIYSGNNMANVPELKWMKVVTQINENDFLKIHTGQKVAVRLDAMPEIVFNGETSYIGKLCHPKERGSKEKVFDVEVKVTESDERLKPGMTVSCEFLADK